MNVTIEVSTRWSQRWIRVAAALRYVVGERLAHRLAVWGAWRFSFWRIEGGRWQRFEAP